MISVLIVQNNKKIEKDIFGRNYPETTQKEFNKNEAPKVLCQVLSYCINKKNFYNLVKTYKHYDKKG